MTSRQLLRGLVILGLFSIGAGAGPNDHLCGGADVPARLVVGKPATFHLLLDLELTSPVTPYCETDEEGEGWSCSGPRPTESTCTGRWVTDQTVTETATPTLSGVTCAPDCTATFDSAGSVTVTPTALGALTVTATATNAAVPWTTKMTVLANEPLIAADIAKEPQWTSNVFLPGQTFTWCLASPADFSPVDATATASGEVETVTTEGKCTTFRTRQKGSGHVAFAGADGTSAAADVTVVDPADVVALQFVSGEDWPYGAALSTSDLLAGAPAITSSIAYYGSSTGSHCALAPTAAVRFSVADGRTGLVPADEIELNRELGTASVTVGSASTSVALDWVAFCSDY